MTVKAKKGAEARKRSYSSQWARTERNKRKKLEKMGFTGAELQARLKKYQKGSDSPLDPKKKQEAPQATTQVPKVNYTRRTLRPGSKLRSWDNSRHIGWVKQVPQTMVQIDPETGNKTFKTVMAEQIILKVPGSGHYPVVKVKAAA